MYYPQQSSVGGIVGGRPKSLDVEKRNLAVKLYRERQHSVEEICRLVGVSKPTLYSYVRQCR
ncbi:MAG: helix-turn-helix domain-containing protein [Candidatus Andersenbacteria bacterium]|nr:helix-turn-helix domain-containing protein [Candidatus Andersenbacteria bacterium]